MSTTDPAMKPSCRRVLERLRQGPATTAELLQPDVGGGRFGGRLGDLRGMGFKIDSKRLRPGSHLYTLVGEPERALSEAKDPDHGIQADPGSIPSTTEGVRSAAPAQAHDTGSLFDADEFAQRGTWKDAA
jgi:hypothetical protein